MNIYINGCLADITLDTEKTLGDVLSGVEHWVSLTGSRVRAIAADGQLLEDDALSGAFDRDVQGIEKLDITVSAYRELAAEALSVLSQTCQIYQDVQFEERPRIAAAWGQSAAARFLQSDIPDLYDLAGRAFSGEGLAADVLSGIVHERLREITGPEQEIAGCEALVKHTIGRMEELPLDVQTGKDQRAAETIQHFAKTGEKLFRIFFILKSQGLSPDTFAVDGVPFRTFMEEFNAALTEISAAYENKDTVLVGDLSEYELAPRLLNFFFALKHFSEVSFDNAAVSSAPGP
ncbi:MAG: hypothetical protein FWC64_11195 [Treponema sp.]|nr:hypothetical protein [Treponema sp.]